MFRDQAVWGDSAPPREWVDPRGVWLRFSRRTGLQPLRPSVRMGPLAPLQAPCRHSISLCAPTSMCRSARPRRTSGSRIRIDSERLGVPLRPISATCWLRACLPVPIWGMACSSPQGLARAAIWRGLRRLLSETARGRQSILHQAWLSSCRSSMAC